MGEFDLIKTILTTFSPQHFRSPFEKYKSTDCATLDESTYSSKDPIIIDNKQIIFKYDQLLYESSNVKSFYDLFFSADDMFLIFFDPTDQKSINITKKVSFTLNSQVITSRIITKNLFYNFR